MSSWLAGLLGWLGWLVGVALNCLIYSVLDGFACCEMQQAKPFYSLVVSWLGATLL
jgi:hypothetical protein